MSLLFMDGFDHYATADITKKWTSDTASVIHASAGRRGGGCLSTGNSSLIKALPNSATLIVGAAIYLSGYPARSPIRFGDSGSPQASLCINADGKLSLYRGNQVSGTVLGTSTNALGTGAYNYVEVKITFHNSAGAYEVRVNGAVWLSGSSVDTCNTANNYANQFILGYEGNPGAVTSYLDDVYVCDGAGSTNNDFLGDCRIDALRPTSDGTYAQMAPSTGTDHYALVDETSVNTTDYNSSATSGQKDTYGMSNLPSTPTSVFGVQVGVAALKADSGTRGIKPLIRSGSTDSLGTELMLSTSQLFALHVYEQDPSTSAAWTESGVNAAEVGVQIST